MAAEFGGEVVGYYAKYRRGYDSSVIGWLTDVFALDADSTVVDLGCGTGQLAIPISERVRAVVGIDPVPEMLAQAAADADRRRRANVCWMLGSDDNLGAVRALLGARLADALLIGNAIHLMDQVSLFDNVRSVLRPGGGVAVIANGTPIWQQDSACSEALRTALEDWFGTKLTSMCGTDEASRAAYAGLLRAAGYTDVEDTVVSEYDDELDLEWVIGHLYSAIPQSELPASERRSDFEQLIRDALGPAAPFTEHVRVSVLSAR